MRNTERNWKQIDTFKRNGRNGTHENRLQGNRKSKTNCNVEETLKQIARNDEAQIHIARKETQENKMQ